jgi:hypothetical protein
MASICGVSDTAEAGVNRIRVATDAEFARARKEAFAAADGRCVKCGATAAEGHHAYGPLDNDPRHIRPLCYRCHAVAPTGDAYWEWERSGKTGDEIATEYARAVIRSKMPDLADAEFDGIFAQIVPAALAVLGRCNS